jgi:2,3-diketo-5-methylthio-1-phosphopentane phosphatase
MSQPKLYLLDIEGTVAPISFVTETLFPYARARLAAFLGQNFNDPPVRADLALLTQERQDETDASAPPIHIACRRASDGLPAFVATSIPYLLWLMDRDRKSTALKSLQGKIWKAGYESGELQSILFDDVPEALALWSKQARIAIYSSGSADAQQLFFRYSNHGDLTPMIGGYFDTRTGPKQAVDSYKAIAMEMEVEPPGMLFFSDAVRELDAARQAGCGTRLVTRPGNPPVDTANGHAIIRSFQEEENHDHASGTQKAGGI